MRRLVVFVAVSLLAGSAQAGVLSPPILLVTGVNCPASSTCESALYNGHIAVLSASDSTPRALSSPADNDSEPSWAPNRAQIVFVRTGANGGGDDIWLMNADGSAERQLTHSGGGVDVEPRWSPDGSEIVFRGNSPNGQTFDLYTIKTDGTRLTRLTSNPDSAGDTVPDWSPSGAEILYTHEDGNSDARSGVYVMRRDGSDARRLAEGGDQPVWSPNGRKIAYVNTDAANGDVDVYVMNADGSSQVRLTTGADDEEPSWSPSGKQILFLRDNRIFVINANGSGIAPITLPLKGSRFVENPDW